MTRVLIIGGSSLLGKYLFNTKPDNFELESTWFTNHIGNYHLDICSYSQVAYVLNRARPEIIIHCAAIGSVDFAENHFPETHMVNVIGTRNLLNACREFKSKFVYISTNAVFDGKNPPYNEESQRLPVNAYGTIKREAEQAVLESDLNYLIIRPFLLYGWPYETGRQNWMTTILSKLDKGEEIKLVNDTFWQPTSAEDCAATIWKLIGLNQWREVYHVASDDKMTLYDFGLKVTQVFGKDTSQIQPISSDKLRIAPRPKDTQFDLSKIHNLGIQLKNVEEGLKYESTRLGMS